MTGRYAVEACDAASKGGVSAREAIDRLAAQASREHAAAVERAILAGANRVEVEGYFGQRHVYEAPSWRRHPIHRVRIALARLRHRLAARLRETR